VLQQKASKKLPLRLTSVGKLNIMERALMATMTVPDILPRAAPRHQFRRTGRDLQDTVRTPVIWFAAIGSGRYGCQPIIP
jgi:hypothetical protein